MYERKVGRFDIRIEHRTLDTDQGLCIHVYGPTPKSQHEELLRFDCFEHEPHYHVAWSYRQDPFIRIDSPEPFEWSLVKLNEDFSGLLQSAGACALTEREVAQIGPLIEEIGNVNRETFSTES